MEPSEIIESILKAFGLKQKELAAQLKVTPSQINMARKGKRSISPRLARKLFEEYGISMEYTLLGQGGMFKKDESNGGMADRSGDSTAEKFREFKDVFNYTNEELAERLGVRIRALADIDEGRVRMISSPILVLFQKTFHINPAWWFSPAEMFLPIDECKLTAAEAKILNLVRGNPSLGEALARIDRTDVAKLEMIERVAKMGADKIDGLLGQ